MKFLCQQHRSKRSTSGFTMVELALAVALTLGISAALIGLIQQQISFTSMLNNFRFLRDEAPQVNTLMTNIINRADNYRIYPDLARAKQLSGAVRSGGTAIRLRFRNPDGTSDHAIVAFEQVSGEKQLNYYFRAHDDVDWSATPNWTISASPDQVTFDNTAGVLLITLTGVNGDQIAYAGTPD